MRVTDVGQQHVVELFVEEGLGFEKDDFEGVSQRGYLSCLLERLQHAQRFWEVGLKMKVDLHFEQAADCFVFPLFLLLGVGECLLHSYQRVVVELVLDEHSHDGYEFLQQLLLHESVLSAEVDQFLALVVGIDRSALLELYLVDRASDLDDFQWRKSHLFLLLQLTQLPVQ